MRTDNVLRSSEYEPLRPRDLAVLRWVCEQCAARRDHVRALIGLSEAMARESVARLVKAGLLRSERYIVRESAWLLPTRAGLNAWGGGGRVLTPTLGQLAHFAAINDVRLHVQRRRPDAEWIPERRLRRERGEAGRGQHSHIPDGVVLLDGHRVAIEVELNHKSRKATEAVLQGHAREYDAALYFCARDAYGQLRRLEQSGRFPKFTTSELWKLGEERPAEPAVGPRADATGGTSKDAAAVRIST